MSCADIDDGVSKYGKKVSAKQVLGTGDDFRPKHDDHVDVNPLSQNPTECSTEYANRRFSGNGPLLTMC